jgi:hypothetical protein
MRNAQRDILTSGNVNRVGRGKGVGRGTTQPRRLAGFMLASVVVAAFGCSVDANENLGEADEFLGEVGCATQTCNAGNSCAAVSASSSSNCSYDYFYATSPDAGYGNASCPNAYTAAVTSTAVGRKLVPVIDWGDTALTSTDCASGKLDLAVHTRPNSSSSWTSTTRRYHGVWVPTPFNYCSWVLNTGYPDPTEITTTSTSELRVAGTAKVGSTGYRIVKVGVRSGHGPC